MKREIILAIETAIGGGSISLLDKKSEIDFWIGESERLRAENLLLIIAELLSKNGLQKSDIKKIVYSEGPGSHTGIRIGAATSQGLQSAFGCEWAGATMLKALTLRTETKGCIQTAIQTSQNSVWRQSFEKSDSIICKTLPDLVSDEIFLSELNDFQEIILLTSDAGYYSHQKIVNVSINDNLARLIGLTSRQRFF